MTAVAPTPRRFLPRFSLRELLLAVTAFAIGFPIWYRWPYEEKELLGRGTSGAGPVTMRRVKTWQRQWGGGRLQHGEERVYLNDKLYEVSTYRVGKLHGRYRRFNSPENYVEVDGQYDQGVKNGAWRCFDPQGQEFAQTEYAAGKIVRAVHQDRDGKEQVWEFRDNQGTTKVVTHGIDSDDRLARRAAQGEIDDARVCESLRMPITVKLHPGSLEYFASVMGDFAGTPAYLDPHHVDPHLPMSGACHELPLSIALTAFTAPHGLACDYRYGAIWITSMEDANDWDDPTGVADIVPSADSPLAKAWNTAVPVAAVDQPLVDTLEFIAQTLAIEIDTSQLSSDASAAAPIHAKINLFRMPLRHSLGMLLYQTRCRCKLEGETLVILPPEGMP
jgi:hypothetical protein